MNKIECNRCANTKIEIERVFRMTPEPEREKHVRDVFRTVYKELGCPPWLLCLPLNERGRVPKK